MPATPYNNTSFLRVQYSFAGGERSLQVRHPGTEGADDISQLVRGLLYDHSDCFTNDVVFHGAQHHLKDALVSIPVDWLPVVGTGGAAATDPFFYPRFLSFGGRSLGGAKTSVKFYGTAGTDGLADKYRLNVDDAGVWESFWADWVGNWSAGSICAIDGQAVYSYNYINVGINAYYQRKARR